MKVTRLRRGYRIACSDTEFMLLVGLAADGLSTFQGDDEAYQSYLSPQEKAALTRRERGGSLLRIDDDRRARR